MIKCNLRSVEVNTTLEMSKISLHGIVYIVFFIYATLFNILEIKQGQEYA